VFCRSRVSANLGSLVTHNRARPSPSRLSSA
jgi:hypothetical protein